MEDKNNNHENDLRKDYLCITKEGREAEDELGFEFIAMLCHQLNKEYCNSIGDKSQPDWKDAPAWQRESELKGVAFHFDNPFAGPEASHESWMAEKEADGWVYGETKDPEKKEHPCMVAYEELPQSQQMKDYLFKAVVDSFRNVFLPPYQGYAELDSHTKDVQANKQLRKDGDEFIMSDGTPEGTRKFIIEE